jgi:hypothetical protein
LKRTPAVLAARTDVLADHREMTPMSGCGILPSCTSPLGLFTFALEATHVQQSEFKQRAEYVPYLQDGAKLRVHASGQFVETGAMGEGLALINRSAEWKTQFQEKGWML